MRSLALALLAGIALLALASALSFRLAEAHLNKPYDVLHVPSGRAARVAALGHRTFVSDLYWLSAVQYIGERRAGAGKSAQLGFDKLLPLVDLVTDLDPRHGYAYQTAGIVLSAAGRLDESDAILRKGMERGPPWWSFPYYLSFNYWFYRGDLATAAHYAEIAARKPGASANISHLAVSLASKSGTPEEAITLLQELKATVKDEATAGRLDEQLKLAVLERDAQMLERAVAELEKQRGWPIASLEELVMARIVPAIPPDPFGGRYVWIGAERRVRSSVNSFRFELQEGRHQPGFHYQAPETNKERMLR
jgi:tetratricopeptide (TPR) repeat protein